MNAMKLTAALSIIVTFSISGIASAQPGAMKDMEKKGMDMQECMNMKGMKNGDMKGMDMKGMDAQKCKDMMSGKDNMATKDAMTMTHKAKAVVKDVDAANGKVTLAHEAVKSLNWPAMKMAFSVKDKALFDKLAVGKKVNVEFKKEGTDYVVTAVK